MYMYTSESCKFKFIIIASQKFAYHMHSFIFCSEDALKASNEKQSDTVDTGVQADYLTVAPG